MSEIDFVEWAEKFIILPNGDFIRFMGHQKAILNHIFSFDEGGRLNLGKSFLIIFSKLLLNKML